MIAPGLWTVNVSKSTTSAFTTSRNHHFLSFVTMIGPSPDWITGRNIFTIKISLFSSFVGVSGLDLCLSNCTWMDSYEELLHPIDAGTDMGVRYNVNHHIFDRIKNEMGCLSRDQNDQKILVNQSHRSFRVISPIIDHRFLVRI
jgi:hypothetical protein